MSRERTGPRGSERDRARTSDPPPELVLREVVATLSAEARRCVARANEQALRLERIATDAVDAVGDVHLEDPPEELAYRAHRLRGVVLNALLVVAEFQLVAGKLDALAAIQQVTEQLRPDME